MAIHLRSTLLGESPAEMSSELSLRCERAHRLARDLSLHSFPFDETAIPANGLYILFEKGEEGHGGPRIVRIGTHTGQNQLRSRLRQHFLLEKKDRSIFRKNVGRCLLSRERDSYLETWERDFTTRAARIALPPEYDVARQTAIEASVSAYIRESFTFVTVEVNNKADRLRLEAGLVSLVSLCPVCRPSPKWLGLDSPKQHIRESGLWQVNELYKQPIDVGTLDALMTPNSNFNAEGR